MKAKIEPLTGIMRVWVNDRANYGDPFLLAVSVRWLAPGAVEILGLTRMTTGIWRAIRDEMRAWGITRVLCVKYRRGMRVEKWIKVK